MAGWRVAGDSVGPLDGPGEETVFTGARQGGTDRSRAWGLLGRRCGGRRGLAGSC